MQNKTSVKLRFSAKITYFITCNLRACPKHVIRRSNSGSWMVFLCCFVSKMQIWLCCGALWWLNRASTACAERAHWLFCIELHKERRTKRKCLIWCYVIHITSFRFVSIFNNLQMKKKQVTVWCMYKIRLLTECWNHQLTRNEKLSTLKLSLESSLNFLLLVQTIAAQHS